MSSTFQKLLLALVLAALSIQPAAACAACYGDPDAPMSRGLTWAILALCAVVGVVLSGVVMFFVHVGHQSAKVSRVEGRDDVSNSRG
jgi:uncharacterized membrane protein YqhA